MERDKRAALEIMVQKMSGNQSVVDYQQSLSEEIEEAVCSREMLLHGPDTVERFEQFSMSTIISELQSSCPQVYKLIQ